jgi:putative membrane protein
MAMPAAPVEELARDRQEATKSWPRGRTPQDAGLILTLMGTLAMVMGTIEYWQTLKLTRRFKDIRLTRFPMAMAVVMSLAGIVLFLSIATRVF